MNVQLLSACWSCTFAAERICACAAAAVVGAVVAGAVVVAVLVEVACAVTGVLVEVVGVDGARAAVTGGGVPVLTMTCPGAFLGGSVTCTGVSGRVGSTWVTLVTRTGLPGASDVSIMSSSESSRMSPLVLLPGLVCPTLM